MFCPQCKVEYRPGFTQCSDCEVDLVQALPEGPSPDNELTPLWECADQAECVGVCEDLRRADIPYQVDETLGEKTTSMGVKWHYRVQVSRGDFDRAKELFGIDAPQNTIPRSEDDDEEIVDPTVELADAGVPLDDSQRHNAYLDPWYPEDATVAVWSQDADDLSPGTERALDANYIHCRCDSDDSDAKKIFVRPEDESFAREIVREIIDRTPRA